MDLHDIEELKAQVHELSEPAFKELAVLYALKQVAADKGLTLHQLSDFHSPWSATPSSKEEEYFQDLVWIHRALPPNEKFSPLKAKKGFYRALKFQILDQFWDNYDPTEKEVRPFRSKANLKRPSTTLQKINQQLAGRTHVL